MANIYTYSDKNRAPGAVEAFKAVGNAVAILTDAEKRKSYDLYGSEDQQSMNRSGYHRTSYQYGYTRGFEADVTAEELFNMFFGGGAFPTQNVYSSRQRRYTRPTQEEREVNIFRRFSNVVSFLLIKCILPLFTARIHCVVQSYTNPASYNIIWHVIIFYIRPDI